MFGIIKEKIKVGNLLNGEQIIIKTTQFTNLDETKIIIRYSAWGESDYEEHGTYNATRIPLSDVASEIDTNFDKVTENVTYELGNSHLKEWIKSNLGLIDTDFFEISE